MPSPIVIHVPIRTRIRSALFLYASASNHLLILEARDFSSYACWLYFVMSWSVWCWFGMVFTSAWRHSKEYRANVPPKIRIHQMDEGISVKLKMNNLKWKWKRKVGNELTHLDHCHWLLTLREHTWGVVWWLKSILWVKVPQLYLLGHQFPLEMYCGKHREAMFQYHQTQSQDFGMQTAVVILLRVSVRWGTNMRIGRSFGQIMAEIVKDKKRSGCNLKNYLFVN